MGKVEVKEATLSSLKLDSYDGFVGKIYRFVIEVPADCIQRTEPGQLLAFNVSSPALYELILGTKRAYVTQVQGGRATLSVEVGESYISIALKDLKRLEDSYLIVPDEESTTVQKDESTE